MISLKAVKKEYQVNKNEKVVALKNIDLEIKDNEVVILKGASGSGKSTILSLIAALSKPTSGEVIVDEKRISKLPDHFASTHRRDNIGFIFQKFNLIPNLTVENNLLLPLIPNNPDEKEVKNLIEQTMKKFNIFHKKDIQIKNLSGGEQQRTAIARAMVNDPKIIIADEPTANLDENLSKHFLQILKELKDLGKTVVVATHDPIFNNLDFKTREINIKNGEICS
ncbi:MAG: ABC transporter ATP-binding protein [Campylobacterales bacterium]|nr:ABC transporter ATP-binding protein [Campylobacterales bacterium]